MNALVTTDTEVVDAITGQRLAAWSGGRESEAGRVAARTCASIGAQVLDDLEEVVGWLAARGHRVQVDDADVPRQRHDVRVRVTSFDAADAIATALDDIGFERWDRWTGAAARSFRQHADQITVARTTDRSFVLRLRWASPPSGGRVRRLVRSVFRPTPADWTIVSLPTRMWPAYSMVRPVRLVLERLGLRDRHAAGLGPFLSTPRSLVPALLDLAGLGPDDVLLDLGCGDGRLAVTASVSVGCRSIGAENDPGLAHRAREAARLADVEHLVSIVEGDAREVRLDAIDAAFMFLPMDVVAELLATTLDRLPSGARLIVHEQTALPPSLSPRPESSFAVIADDAVTVAHRWIAP